MKKALSIILAAACMMNFTACGDDDNGGGSKSSKASKEQSIEDCIVRIKDYRLTTATYSEGEKPVLLIKYEFYNNSDEEKSFGDMFNDKVFQNGVECSSTFVYDNKDFYDSSSSQKDVLPGYTYEADKAYVLSDDSDVTVKVTEFSYTNKKKTYIDETISLENAKYSSDATESSEETSE